MITNVTIISTNINKGILNNYKNYHIIYSSFNYEELLQYKNVIFFNVLSNLESENIKKLYEYLRFNNINFINLTNNVEEVMYTDYLVVYDKEKVLIEGNTIEVLKNEKLLRRLGIKIPFIIDLSLLLKDYNLINKIYLDKESLVGDLWK